jgi:hypothetical protein
MPGDSRVPERKSSCLPSWGTTLSQSVAGILLFFRCDLFTSPLRFAEYKPGVYGSRISRRCLRRKLPFLPVPWQVFIENLINSFGDEPKYLNQLELFRIGQFPHAKGWEKDTSSR